MLKLWQHPLGKLGISFVALLLLIGSLALPALTVRTLGDPVIFEAEGFASNRNIDGSLIQYQLAIETVPLDYVDPQIIAIYEAQQAAFEGFGPLFRLEDVTLYLHISRHPDHTVSSTYLTLSPPANGHYLKVHSHILNYDYRSSEATPPLIGIDIDFNLPPFNSSLNFVSEGELSFDRQPILVHARLYRGRIQVVDITRP